MNSRVKISIIVPVYNVERYLPRCIDSILAQTFTDFELIIVDDGSPDNCPQICDDYAQKDNRIKVIHKENGGLSSARNAGLDIASGEYIGFVDSDDYIHPHMYEKLYKSLIENKSDMSICNAKIVGENGCTIISRNQALPIGSECLTGKEVLCEKILKNEGWRWIVAWPKLYSKKLFDDVRFPDGKIHEDEFIAHLIFSKCNKVSCIKEHLYYYVQRNGSIMESNYSAKRLDLLEALLFRIKFFVKNKYPLKVVYSNYLLYIEKFQIACNTLGRKNKELIERYTSLQNLYRNVFFELYRYDSSFKHRCLYILNYISLFFEELIFKVYYKFRSILGIIKYKIVSKIDLSKYAKQVATSDAVLIDTPQHGNLGDQAIALTEQQCFSKYNYDVYDLTAVRINFKERYYANRTPKNKIVFVQGGGFLGSIWPLEEERFRRILTAFKDNKIIVFPQTVTFDLKNKEGIEYLRASQEIYSSHPDLTVFVREKTSFDFMKEYFPSVNCKLVPDIVTVLNTDVKTVGERRNILFCLRSDKEKSLDGYQIDVLEKVVENALPDDNIVYTDTVIRGGVFIEDRKAKVDEKLQQFADSKLVVTDRLHGMIFAAITGTPCIAFGNINGKVKHVYEWLKNLDYIKYADDVSEFDFILSNMNLETEYRYNNEFLQNDFLPLYESIRNMKNESKMNGNKNN